MKNLNRYQEQGKFRNWLFGIAHNIVIDYSRKSKRKNEVFTKIDNNQKTENVIEKIPELYSIPDKHLEKNPKSLLSKIFGLYKIKIPYNT